MGEAAALSGRLVLRLADPGRRPAAVRVLADPFKRGPAPALRRVGRGWEAELPPLEADRLEYLLELTAADGSTEIVTHPDAPTASGPFGAKSVLEAPGYAPPAWLAVDAAAGPLEPVTLPSRVLRATVDGLVWSPAGSEPAEPLPLLVVHDGPEFAEHAALTRYLDAMTATRSIPPVRAALLAPVERNETYSAAARYARALHEDLLPALAGTVPVPPGRRHRAGMGASLGALAWLHAHRRYPDLVGALFLQSGSFFRRRADRHEAGFVRFERITRFVREVLRTPSWPGPVPVGMTCGLAEENLDSNRVLAAALAAQGYPVSLTETRDAHNWVSWRDAWDPPLTELLARSFG